MFIVAPIVLGFLCLAIVLLFSLLVLQSSYVDERVRYIPLNSSLIRLIPHIPKSSFLDLSFTYGIVSSQIYDKQDDFNFETVNFLFLMGMFLTPLPMVHTLHLFVLPKYVLMLMTSTTETKGF